MMAFIVLLLCRDHNVHHDVHRDVSLLITLQLWSKCGVVTRKTLRSLGESLTGELLFQEGIRENIWETSREALSGILSRRKHLSYTYGHDYFVYNKK